MEEVWLIVGPAQGLGWHALKVLDHQGNIYACAAPEGLDSPTPFAPGIPALLIEEGAYIAKHFSKESAEAGVKAAKAAELQVRPFWQEVVALQERMRALMYEAAVAAAQPPNKIN